MEKKKILMIYPEIPTTYWSYHYTLSFIGKKSLMPPLGLMTIAAMIPDRYEIQLVDMNVEKLEESCINNADLVMISAMIVQKESFSRVIQLCNQLQVPVAAGGPYPTSSFQNITGVDYFILNEGEVTLPLFLADYEAGTPKKIYINETKPDITKTPFPRFDLIDMDAYVSMPVQSSRGCPFNCEFCDIIEMFGRNPRYKTPDQFIKEMDTLYNIGWRGSFFIVDDNFIGNKSKVRELLTHIAAWQKEHNYPFNLFTEASINLAQDDALMDLMIEAGLDLIFVGIETPVAETLAMTQKNQNTKIDLHESIKKMQEKGIEIMGGFIVGFDNDPKNIFDLQIDLIQKAGIPVAMIGNLTALPNTQLWRRLEKEGRILKDTAGNNTDFELNFITKMPKEDLAAGYRKILSMLYSPKNYFKRCRTLIKRLPKGNVRAAPLTIQDIKALFLSLKRQLFSLYGLEYFKLLISTLWNNPKRFPQAINLAVKGYHFFKITDELIEKNNFTRKLNDALCSIKAGFKELSVEPSPNTVYQIKKLHKKIKRSTGRDFKRLSPPIKKTLKQMYTEFTINADIAAYNTVLTVLQGMKTSLKHLSLN